MKRLIIGLVGFLFSMMALGESTSGEFAELREKAHAGDANAQCELGLCYSDGRGVEKSYEEAVKWYRISAEQGFDKAQCNLGVCYQYGQGVEKSYEEAVNWYRKAAEQGNATAQCNLGVCYETGRGVEKSYEEAVNWYRKAAEQGEATAQHNLGVCYQYGQGVEKSEEEAKKWFRLSWKEDLKNALQKSENIDESVLNLKGFMLGMNVNEACALLDYYFPDFYIVKQSDRVIIRNYDMLFCQLENGRVVRFNFTRRMLDKLFDYDAQTIREWAILFAREHETYFRIASVSDQKSAGMAYIEVYQECYTYRDRKRGAQITVFDQKRVYDTNEDPEQIENEAQGQAMAMMFSGRRLSNADINHYAVNAGYRAQNVRSVRKWLKEEYVNGRGAEEGTLRIEAIKY